MPPANTLALEYPARGLHVALTITGIMDALKQATGTAIAGCNRTFDFAGKFLGITNPKCVQKAGSADAAQRAVSQAEFLD